MSTRLPEPRQSISVAAVLWRLAVLAWGLVWSATAIVLFLVSVTWTGRAAGLLGLAIGLWPALLGFTKAWRAVRRRGLLGIGLLGICGGAAALWFAAPGGATDPAARVREIRWSARTASSRPSLFDPIPEQDQLAACFLGATALDPVFTHRQFVGLRQSTGALYAELAADREFAVLGTQLDSTYADLAGWQRDDGRAYLYIPAGLDRRSPCPVLLFFHGSGGNFKGYLWLLSKIADEHGLVVVAPDGGFGVWKGRTAVELAGNAMRSAAPHVTLDLNRLYVAGLSNGGRAACQLLASHEFSCRAALFFSPVFDEDSILSSTDAVWRDRSIFILSGGDDDRVPAAYVKNIAEHWRLRRANVRVEMIEDANHFVFFSHAELVRSRVREWLNGVRLH